MDKNHLVEEEGEGKSLNFIEQIIEEELAEGKNGGRVHTRFPPEPNGYQPYHAELNVYSKPNFQ